MSSGTFVQTKIMEMHFLELNKWETIKIPKCSIRHRNRIKLKNQALMDMCGNNVSDSANYFKPIADKSNNGIVNEEPECELPPLEDFEDMTETLWIDEVQVSYNKILTFDEM